MSLDDKENDVDAIRAEIKKWEHNFKHEHGHKPGRADVKGNAEIAAKYKRWEVLTGRRKEKPSVPRPAETPTRKTRHPATKTTLDAHPKPSTTPRKTPSKSRQIPLQPPAASPVQEIEATPAFIKAALGPTPQKDGQILGIFDIVDTPTQRDVIAPLGTDAIVTGTPSKQASSTPGHKVSRTPQSSGKRFFLDAFVGTPGKRKREDGDIGTCSALKRKYATPSFLRRSFPMASIDEENADAGPKQPPFGKRGLVRSLSSIIQGLKKQEEERMDDEMDVLREMENQEEDSRPEKAPPKLLVQDSQATDMPLGPDQAEESSDVSSGLDDEAKARKPWKKKGLKRQTRRTKMRPVVNQAQKADAYDSHNESETEVVAETQQVGGGPHGEEPYLEEDNVNTASNKKASSIKTTTKEGDSKKAGKPRKVNEQAHANYRALKIKNKNSKGKGGGRRFGRR